MGMFGDWLGGLGSSVGGLIGLLEQSNKPERDYETASELFAQLQEPDFDINSLTPEQLQVVGEYLPQVYDFVAPKDPRYVEESDQGRAAQTGALDYFTKIRDQGLPELMKLDAEEAQNKMAQSARSNQLAVMEALQRRGMSGGGSEQAQRMIAGQQASDMARGQGNDLARQAIQARLQAASQGADIGTTLRNTDLERSAQNAAIWNNFQRFLSQGQTEAARDAAAARQQAQTANTQNRQNISNTNTNLRNQYAMRNQEYANQMKQQGFGNALQKASGQAGALQQLGDYGMLKNAAMMQNYQQLGKGFGQFLGSAGDIGMAGMGGQTGSQVPWWQRQSSFGLGGAM